MSQKSNKDIILQFKGHLNYDIIGELIGSLKDSMKIRQARYGLYKKLLTLLIESLENVVRYNHEIPSDGEIFIENPPELQIVFDGEYYILEISNIIYNADIPSLEEKISELNSFNKLKIKELYKATITDGKFSEKGGAGLGLIEMAKIIDSKMEYSFKALRNDISLFILKLSLLDNREK